MIKYSYKDKELKVPSGIGNNNEGFDEGYDLGYEEGFEVAYPSGYTNGFAEGHVSGVTEQKAKLVSTAITENGTYSRENGFNEVEVNVQPPLETLSVSQSGMVATYTPDDGYYGISNIEVNAEGYGAKRWQDGIDWEYNRISQSAITLSFSGNGEWHKDFFSEVFCNEVIVNVPVDDIYASGYTSGVTDGFAMGHASGVTDGFNLGYPSGHTDGYNSGYTIGRQDGASYENDRLHQIAIPLTFSGNGEWQQEMFSDVFCNHVVVNVPKIKELEGYHLGIGFKTDGEGPHYLQNYFSLWDEDGGPYVSDYIASAYCPEVNVKSAFTQHNQGMAIHFSGSGYHIVWLALKQDLPDGSELMRCATTSAISMVILNSQYKIDNIFEDSSSFQVRISTIIDVADNMPNVTQKVGSGNWYYPSSRTTAPSVQGWTAVPIDDNAVDVIRNLYKF